MIRAFVGRGGSGKTFAAVRYLWGLWKSGRAVYSTTPLIDLRVKWDQKMGMWLPVNAISFGIDWADGYLTNIKEIYTLDNCECFLDEVGAWLPAKGFRDVPDDFFRFLAQDRREGVNITWTHRTFGGALKELRDNTAEVSRSTRWGPIIIQSVFDPDTPAERVPRFLMVSPRIYDLYQTLARVGNREGEGYGLGNRSGYESRDSGGRTLIRLDNYGPHRISIFVRPEQLICIKRKFGNEHGGIHREERLVGDSDISMVRYRRGSCIPNDCHPSYLALQQKRGLTGPGTVNHVSDHHQPVNSSLYSNA